MQRENTRQLDSTVGGRARPIRFAHDFRDLLAAENLVGPDGGPDASAPTGRVRRKGRTQFGLCCRPCHVLVPFYPVGCSHALPTLCAPRHISPAVPPSANAQVRHVERLVTVMIVMSTNGKKLRGSNVFTRDGCATGPELFLDWVHDQYPKS